MTAATATKTRKPRVRKAATPAPVIPVPLTQDELIAAVRAHATTYYDTKWGWDILVECWSDEEIVTTIGAARTGAGAVKKCGSVLWAVAQHRAEIVATADVEVERCYACEKPANKLEGPVNYQDDLTGYYHDGCAEEQNLGLS